LADRGAAPAKGENGGPGDAAGSVSGPGVARAEFENALKLDDTLAAARYQLGIVLLGSSDAAAPKPLS